MNRRLSYLVHALLVVALAAGCDLRWADHAREADPEVVAPEVEEPAEPVEPTDAIPRDETAPDEESPAVLEVLSFSPADGEQSAAVDSAVAVHFSDDLAPSTVHGDSFWLEDAESNVVGADIIVDGASAILQPSAPLLASSTYGVHLTIEVQSSAGTPLHQPLSWSFATAHALDTTAPYIVSTSPQADEGDIATNTSILIAFSEPMNAASLIDAVRLEDMDGATVAATVTGSGNTVTLTPSAKLRRQHVYTVYVEASAADLAGNALGSVHSWSFTTSQSRSWGTPQLVELDNDHTVFMGRIEVDATGNAIAVWEQSNGAHYDLWASRYQVDQGWGAPELIENFDGGSVHISSLQVAPGGNAIVAWSQEVAGVLRIAANTFDTESGWEQAQLIDRDTGNGQEYPQVALDSSGGAIAVWEEVISTETGYSFNVWCNRFEPGSGWRTAEYLENPSAGSVLGETVVPDGVGGLMAIWTHGYGNPDASVWARRYVPGSGWQAPEVVLPYNPTAPRAYYTPEVAFDSSGRGLLVADVSGVGVYSIRYEPGSGWGAPTSLWAKDGSFVRASRLAMNTSGQASALFVRDAGGGYDLWSRYFDPASGWGAATLVADEPASLGFIRHDVGIDESGTAIALWARPSSPLGMYSRSFAPGQGWGSSELIDTPNTQRPAMAVDRQGNATVLYPNTGAGGYSMWAARRD